jgi:hypothetical protein
MFSSLSVSAARPDAPCVTILAALSRGPWGVAPLKTLSARPSQKFRKK